VGLSDFLDPHPGQPGAFFDGAVLSDRLGRPLYGLATTIGHNRPMSPAFARFTRMFVRAALMAALAGVMMRLIVG
jgi:hypothetical protein